MSFYAGIDTSCYTTSFALISETEVILDKRIMLNVPKGERGLRQSDAVFQHVQNLTALFDELKLSYPIKAVGASVSPRTAEGSYMPVFLPGACFAKAFALGANADYYGFSHQEGHLMAGLYSADVMHLRKEEYLAFHISGGTTELLHIKGSKAKVIGGTLDISAGQLIDRVGVALGLDFPCGRQLEELALKSGKSIQIKPNVIGCEIHFSGAETKLLHQVKGEREDIAAAAIQYVCDCVSIAIQNAKKKYGIANVLMVGGVVANRQLRERLGNEAYFATPDLSRDNAVGAALLAREKQGGTNDL